MNKAHQQIMHKGDGIKSLSAGMCLNAVQLLLFISKSWEVLSNCSGSAVNCCFVLKQCSLSLQALALSVSSFYGRGLFYLLSLNVQIYAKLRQYFTYKTLTKFVIFPSCAISVCSFSVEPSKAMICANCLCIGNRMKIRLSWASACARGDFFQL